ncbi:ABC-2 transporter permease [Clostridium tarantellae]|uniref:ABC-2 transporter permease n=1 Tax=Clostridium tarantellae TaxID=39493 RepID=A0A6I1MH86_9CLOT|nr:ABC-2 transporter permease [Clostridium tarantellae]MPQ42194.1 hypothetical protein [Clostridium tarantellae]
MNNIINLVKRNFTTVLLSKKHILFVAVAFIIASISSPNFAIISFSMMLYSLFCTPAYYEEFSNTDYLIATLPINKSDYILSKYITLLIEMIFSLIYALVLFIISMSLAKISLSSSHILTFIGSCLVIGLLYISIIVPTVLKWGFANIRYIFIFIAISSSILASSVSEIIIKTSTIQNLLNNISFLIALTFTMIIIIFIASIFLSISIYKKKELLQ